jgi:hypothetical protein
MIGRYWFWYQRNGFPAAVLIDYRELYYCGGI